MKLPGTRISRRRFLGGVSFAAASAFVYGRYVEPRWLQVSRVTVPLSGGARRPLKLLHLSDLHASSCVSLDQINAGLDAGLAFAPDLICVTGDFITTTWDAPDAYAALLKRLSGAAPTFAVLGNHDGGEWSSRHGGYHDVTWMTSVLRDSGITLLQNQCVTAVAGEWTVNVAGTGDQWAGFFNGAATFANQVAAQPTIVLSHNPDNKADLQAYAWDLLLSGHTHGGQLRIPMVGTPFAPVKDKRYVEGLHRWDERWLHITKGIGNVLGMRINCAPEVSLLTLT